MKTAIEGASLSSGSSLFPWSGVANISLFSVLFIDNIAKGKPTRLSRTDDGGDSSLAVDGNIDPLFESGSCTRTKSRRRPWWRVDFGKEEEVMLVKITITTKKELWEKLKHITIYLGNVDGVPSKTAE